jgi:hypothetical protein
VLDDNNALYVTDERPNAETRYRARFYFDPNSIVMGNGEAHFIFQGLAVVGNNQVQVIRLEVGYAVPTYRLRAHVMTDAGTFSLSGWVPFSDAPHVLELDWRAASAVGANDGGLTLWLDGVQQINLTGLDNDTRRIDRIRLGTISGVDTGTRGSYFIDVFEARRQSYIGP